MSKETMEKMVSFWAKPTTMERLDAICKNAHIGRSVVLRILVNLFLKDKNFQDDVIDLAIDEKWS